MYDGDSYSLRDDAQFKESGGNHRYILPFERDDIRSAFDSLGQAISTFGSLATSHSDEDYGSSFIYAKRRFSRIFTIAYDYEISEVDLYNLPTVGEIHSSLRWDGGVQPQTFTIEKTENNLFLGYEQGFHADDEVVSIAQDDDDELLKYGVRSCGKGIKNVHAPYKPSFGEGWRYNPSKMRVSVEASEEDVRLGIESDSASQPLWSSLLSRISTHSNPYAYVTFDMNNQTSVMKYTYNNNHPEEDHI